MRLKTNKTWSQQELALKLGVGTAAQSGLLTWERKRLLTHAAKTALAATLCWWLALRFGLHDGYWGAISAIIVLQSNFGATITASRDRILGTFIGAVLGFTFSLFGTVPWNYILAVFVAIVVCGLLGFRSSSRLAGVTITIVMLVQSSSHKAIALDRVLQVMLGIVVAVVVTTLIFPDRARVALRDGLTQEFLVLGHFFEAVLWGFRGSPASNLESLRQDALALLRANLQLLQASRNEPSGGPGWREGLEILAQSGRSIFDSLVALELAVRGSSEDGYAEQLEPVLGKLVADIDSGFHYVAGCIHKWRFHIPPPGLQLEDDIVQLEKRMSELRPRGISFTQAEILRAYAVQLHLKQLARLLRAARVDTSQAIGEAQKL
jgi:Fusaric acid resistance protein family